MLAATRQAGQGSFLTVLKRFGSIARRRCCRFRVPVTR
jgi:hypothetical protein